MNNLKSAVAFFFLFFLHGTSFGNGQQGISYNYQIDDTKNKSMNNNYLHELKHDATRQVVISHVGSEIPIKEHNGWKFINYNGTKIGLSKIPILKEESEEFNYIFNYGFTK